VRRLKKGSYGLVQAGRTWNEELNAHMESEGFTATPKDPAMCLDGPQFRSGRFLGGRLRRDRLEE